MSMQQEEIRGNSEQSARVGQTATFGLDSNGMPVFLDKLRSYDDAEDNQQQASDIVMNEPQV